MEIELKLLIAPADTPRLRRYRAPAGWSRGASAHRKLLSVYFDSADFFLRRRGIALRVRRDGRRWIQTVKGGGSVKAGLHSRIEIEAEVASDQLDFTKIDDTVLDGMFQSPELQERLEPVFTTEFRRTVWLLESAHGDQVEMALDEGEIRAGANTVPICEVELELKAGNPAALYELALALFDAAPLHLENASKSERGYGLHVPLPAPEPVKAVVPDLHGNISVEQAFQAIAWSCIDHLQCNHNGLLLGEDVEYVHQMRVAIRRLRSAMGLFAKIAPAIRNPSLIEEMRRLAAELSAVRDWDVLLTETLPPVLSHTPDKPMFQHLLGRVRTVCAENRERARRAVRAPRYQKLLLGLGGWLNRAGWRDKSDKAQLKTLDSPILKVSAHLLDKRHKQLCEHGAAPARMSAPERHALRIAGKKLRYAAEFFAPLYPDAQAYLKALAKLQDILGTLNDSVVTRRLLTELIDQDREDTLQAVAIGEIIGWSDCRAERSLAVLDQLWGKFKSRKPFWMDDVGNDKREK